jgi:hypothetical protein
VPIAKRTVVPRFRADRDKCEVDYRDHNGKRHRPLFATEELALAYATEVVKTLSQTVAAIDDPELRLDAYVARWLDTATHEMERKTVASYRQLLNLHVLPVLGHLKLRELHRRHVKALLAAKRADRLRKSDSQAERIGYSKNTVRLIKAALSTVLSDAVDEGYIPTNPAFGAGRKRGKRADSMTQAEKSGRCRGIIETPS